MINRETLTATVTWNKIKSKFRLLQKISAAGRHTGNE